MRPDPRDGSAPPGPSSAYRKLKDGVERFDVDVRDGCMSVLGSVRESFRDDVVQHSLALWQDMGEDGLASSVAAKLARTLCTQGRFGEAERYLALAENAAASDDYELQSTARAARAVTRAKGGAGSG
jgi:hypothetical protein